MRGLNSRPLSFAPVRATFALVAIFVCHGLRMAVWTNKAKISNLVIRMVPIFMVKFKRNRQTAPFSYFAHRALMAVFYRKRSTKPFWASVFFPSYPFVKPNTKLMLLLALHRAVNRL
jgi:hypothetical protein